MPCNLRSATFLIRIFFSAGGAFLWVKLVTKAANVLQHCAQEADLDARPGGFSYLQAAMGRFQTQFGKSGLEVLEWMQNV